MQNLFKHLLPLVCLNYKTQNTWRKKEMSLQICSLRKNQYSCIANPQHSDTHSSCFNQIGKTFFYEWRPLRHMLSYFLMKILFAIIQTLFFYFWLHPSKHELLICWYDQLRIPNLEVESSGFLFLKLTTRIVKGIENY